MFCHWIGTNKTIITTEDKESVQRKLDIETVKEGELTKKRANGTIPGEAKKSRSLNPESA